MEPINFDHYTAGPISEKAMFAIRLILYACHASYNIVFGACIVIPHFKSRLPSILINQLFLIILFFFLEKTPLLVNGTQLTTRPNVRGPK